MQRYTSSTYNNAGYSRTVQTDITPTAKETLIQSTGIGGTYLRREVEAAPPAPIPNYTRTYTSATAITPGRVVETHIGSPVRPARVVTHTHSPAHFTHTETHSPGAVVENYVEHSPVVHTSSITMSPPRPIPSMLRMTSSPLRKPITTTRTHFEPGYTLTEELPTNPHAPPIPLPGETIAVTHATGREGIHTRSTDGFGAFTETVANRKSPVRTYTTTIYEEGELPRTYTTTFQDPVAVAQHSVAFAGNHTFVSSTEAAPLPPAPLAPAPVHHSRVEYNGMGRSEARIVNNGPMGYNETSVQNTPFGHHQRTVNSTPFGHQERNVSSTPFGHQERNVTSNAFGHQERNVSSNAFGHQERNVIAGPYGQEERRVSSTPFGHEETRIQQDAFGRRQDTLTHSPGRIDRSVIASQKIAEAPVLTYY